MKPGFDQVASIFLICLATLPACAACSAVATGGAPAGITASVAAVSGG